MESPPSSPNADYLIIGGGLAGGHALLSIRKKDTRGKVVLVTSEPHLPYDRVPLSKTYLMDKVGREKLFVKTKEFYEQQKVEVLTQTKVLDLDPKSKTVTLNNDKIGDRELSFGKLLLATGGSPKKLPLPGSDLGGIYYLRTLDDCEGIKQEARRDSGNKKAAVIIGGGFIGCELAAAFKTKGLDTTIIEVAPHILGMAIDEETARWIEEYFVARKGVKIITSSSASRFIEGKKEDAGGRRVAGVEVKGETIPADFVVVGVGISPNTEIAERAGLRVDGGILVNEYLETDIEGIYSAGDVARFYSPIFKRHLRVEHYDVAVKHGKVAGGNMASTTTTGEEKRAFDEVPYFFSYQFELNINAFGDLSATKRGAKTVRRGELSAENGFYQFYFDEDNKLSGVLSVNRRWQEVKIAKDLVSSQRIFPNPSEFADESKSLDGFFTLGSY
jgi:3-phenylpropionate/trans-cinnamate dioxygenase ferredoxin reductase subunit